jgi:hypothetical protein
VRGESWQIKLRTDFIVAGIGKPEKAARQESRLKHWVLLGAWKTQGFAASLHPDVISAIVSGGQFPVPT